MKLVTFIFIASAIFDGLLSASCQQSQIPLFGRPVLGEHNKLISPETSAFIKDILSRWNSSGLSVAVVRKDEHESSGWRHEFGSYGIATGDEAPVTPDTVFAIASNSKLFLALSVGLLISNETLAKERGAPIKWNTKISDLIPEWGLMDQDMGKAVTIQDMLSHRTGMPRHDYSLSPHGNGNVSEMISTLRYLTPSAEIRETFQYNNRMYETLSYLPTVLLNQTYESYVAQHLTGPLGMTSTTYSVGEAESSGNFAHGFAWHMRDFTKGLYGTLKPIIPFVFRPGEEFIWSGSGGVLSSAKDLATWVSMLLNEGRHPTTNKTVVPESVVTHVATGVSVSAGIAPYPELSPKTYGGGQWRYSYQGHEVVEHGGSIHGFKTMVARFPNDNLGIVILSNDENGSKIYPIILWRIAGELLGLKQVDWNSRLEKEFKEEVAKAQEFTPRPSSPLPPSAPLVTLTHKRFEHPTYGELMLCAVPQTQPEFIEQSPECASFLDSQAVQQIVNASDVSIPTFIVPYKKSFATHLRLSHFSGDIFNVTAIWTNADMLYGLDDNYNAEWFLGDNNGEEGLAFSGNFFGKEGQVSKAPEGKGKYGAEVWFSRS